MLIGSYRARRKEEKTDFDQSDEFAIEGASCSHSHIALNTQGMHVFIRTLGC